ncbi:MAG: hypothetical protein OXQ86_12610 [Gammaproteobacteria bacterium]|nr:hypothetical protein [Gammaproteobacteria bacterium]MDE0414317.1 hypothetical protein [Gammaproteobacteria bacterium]
MPETKKITVTSRNLAQNLNALRGFPRINSFRLRIDFQKDTIAKIGKSQLRDQRGQKTASDIIPSQSGMPGYEYSQIAAQRFPTAV